MSRDSRFDKLETQRAERPQEERRALGERFAEAPVRKDEPVATAPVQGQALAPAPEGPEVIAPQLKRFETDGANHLSLDTDELVRLPFLRCPECLRDSSKFDRRCIFCQASLETTQARELNLQLLAGYDLERERAQLELRQRHEDGIKQLVEDEFKKQLEVEQEEQVRLRVGAKAGAVGAAVLCFAIALWARSFCVSGALFIIGLALVVAVLPHSVHRVLGASIRPRWRF